MVGWRLRRGIGVLKVFNGMAGRVSDTGFDESKVLLGDHIVSR